MFHVAGVTKQSNVVTENRVTGKKKKKFKGQKIIKSFKSV